MIVDVSSVATVFCVFAMRLFPFGRACPSACCQISSTLGLPRLGCHWSAAGKPVCVDPVSSARGWNASSVCSCCRCSAQSSTGEQSVHQLCLSALSLWSAMLDIIILGAVCVCVRVLGPVVWSGLGFVSVHP